MIENSFSRNQIKELSIQALKNALVGFAPSIDLDKNGCAPSFHDNLLPNVDPKDFEEDLRRGNGNEMQDKFRAAHSSSALGVNCFAPFRRQISDLTLLGKQGYESMRFEAKCPTGLCVGNAPNLDLLLESGDEIIGIESKLTEYLTRQKAKFSPAYKEQIQDHRCDQGWFREMLRLMNEPHAYNWLNAAQLIKHAFGLDHSFPGKTVTLLYLYWEPAKSENHPVFAKHRSEIDSFSQRISGSVPRFAAMSYPELWGSWRNSPQEWLTDHLQNLSARYEVYLHSDRI